MNRRLGLLLFGSLLLNVAFLSGAAVHWWEIHRGRGPQNAAFHNAPFLNAPPAHGPEDLHFDRTTASEWQKNMDRWPERRVRFLDREVKLREEQRRLLAQSLGELRSEMSHLAAELRRSKQELEAVMALDPGNQGLVASRMHSHNRLQARLDSLVAEAMVREARILSPEQRNRKRKERVR